MRILAFVLLAFLASDALAVCVLGIGDCKPKCDKFDKAKFKWAVKAYERPNCTGTERVSAAGDHSQACTLVAKGAVEGIEGSISWYNSGGCVVSFHRWQECKDLNILHLVFRDVRSDGWNHEGGYFLPKAHERKRLQAPYWKVTCKYRQVQRIAFVDRLILSLISAWMEQGAVPTIKNKVKISKISSTYLGSGHVVCMTVKVVCARKRESVDLKDRCSP
jgi:hypothetical protein